MARGTSVLRSIGAILAAIVIGIVLSLVSDTVMRKLGYLPPLGQPASSGPLAVAEAYRTIYGVIGSYVCARLAPSRPMLHSMILGFMGLVVNIIGTVVTWNKADVYGPHWYPVLGILLALPTAWLGAKIRERQLRA